MQHREILSAHPRLVCDHPGVFGVGLGFPAAVGPRGLPHLSARQIAHRLTSIGQYGQQQAGIHRGQIHRPRHLISQPVNLSDEFPDGSFVIDQFARQHHRAGVVNHAHPVMFLADIHTSPHPARSHRTPIRLSANIIHMDNPASISLNKRSHRRSQSAARGSPGRPGGQSFQAAPFGRQASCRLTRPTRVAAQRNNTK